MKLGTAIKKSLLFTAFLMITPVGHADALTCLSRTKEVFIDADWRITGKYRHEFEILEPENILEMNQMIQEFDQNPGLSAPPLVDVRLPDGTTGSWDRGGENNLPAGASVRLSFEITTCFPGFEEMFADSMHIDQSAPVKTAVYRITFPHETDFIYRITTDDESSQNTAHGDFFTWSGADIHQLDIMISTATSREQIARRYQTHFQNRMGDGLPVTDIPEKLQAIDDTRSSDEKVQAVMNFLKNDIAYQVSLSPDHALLPDAPATVLHRGWGDCKDLALLGTALLQKMDIAAFVVLTGTPRPHFSGDAIPDPFIFDHALIGVSQNGQPAYYDCLDPDGTTALNDRQVYLPLEISRNAPQ